MGSRKDGDRRGQEWMEGRKVKRKGDERNEGRRKAEKGKRWVHGKREGDREGKKERDEITC